MAGRPRKIGIEKYNLSAAHQATSEFVHDLLVRELEAVLIPDSDKTVPEEWAPPLTEKEEEDMGLFDSLKEAGVDLGAVELNPFNYADGIYEMAFSAAELLAPTTEGWDFQLELTFQIIGLVSGEETKHKGKPFSERLRMPKATDVKSDDDDVRVKAENALARLFQRLNQLGLAPEVIAGVDVKDINELRGNKYIVPLNTPKPKPGFTERQFVGFIRPKKSDDQATDDLFKSKD